MNTPHTNLDTFLDSLNLNADNLAENAPKILEVVEVRLAEIQETLSSLEAISGQLGGSGSDELTTKAKDEETFLLETQRNLQAVIAESLQLREKIGKVVSTLTEKPQEDIKLEPSDHESEAAQQEILDEKEVGDERPDEADQVQGDNFVIMREEIEQEEETAQEEVVPMGAGEDQVLDVIDVSGEQSSTLPAVVHPSTTGIGGIVMESETPSLFDALDEMGRDEVVSELMPIAMPALPEAGSIAEMRDKEQTISPQVQQALTSLREKVPALGFEDLTPDQVLHMHSFVEKKAEAGRAEIVKDLTDFASTVLMAAASYMRGELPQKTLRIFEEIQRRDGAGDFWFE